MPKNQSLFDAQMQAASTAASKRGTIANPREVMRLELLSSFESFTKVMFKLQYNRSFIVAEHHRAIFSALQDVVDGKCNRLIINMPPRYGKAIDVDTPLLTTDGWRRAGDILEGDKLFDMDGKPTTVTAVYPQGVTDAYEVGFSDGSSLVTCSKHLWLAKTRDDVKRGNGYRVVNTERISRKVNCADDHANWRIPSLSYIDMPESELPIDPYLLGCWLGDGSSYKAEFTSMDDEIIDAFSSEYELSIRTTQNSGRATTYGVRGGLLAQLKALNLIANKHIPTQYLLASFDQRLELLRGLMDTDGTINKMNGQVTLCLTNDKLRQDARTLAESLGYFVTEYIYGADKELSIRAYENPFRLSRKAELWAAPTNKHHTERLVKHVTRVADRETVCFTVDSPSHTYLAGKDLIVTHNTELAIKSFISWCFALNPKCRFLHLSYSDMLVEDNSATIRGVMMEPLYKELFPESELASEKGSSKRWKTKAGGELYAVSTQGQVTGFGAGNVDNTDAQSSSIRQLDGFEELALSDDAAHLMDLIGATTNIFQGAILIDDPMKPEDAESDIVRERINLRFENTIRNRTNSRSTPIIIIMQRLHEHDLCGYLMEKEPDEWRVLSLPAIQRDETTGEEHALWELKHTLPELHRLRDLNPLVFDTQYMQDPTPREGLMYSEGFKTYKREQLPTGHLASRRWNYTDTADTGSDSLCSICFIDTPEFVYVTDVLFTDEPMEVTEPATANMLHRNGTVEALIESNNGGRSFARSVKSILRSTLRNFRCVVHYFTQTKNKQSRIFSASAGVQNDILMPEGWEHRFTKFHSAITGYRKDNKKRQHDDAPDALTGVYEMHARKAVSRGIKQVNRSRKS